MDTAYQIPGKNQTPQMVVFLLNWSFTEQGADMKKVAHYRRAIWVDGMANTLTTMMDDAFAAVPDDLLPTFNISGGFDCMVARRTNHDGARFLHFVTYEEGAPVAVINTRIQAAAVDADEQDPDGENEFIQSQLFCLIFENHVLWATHNEPLREGKIQDILASFALANGVPNEQAQFGFQVVLDQEIIQQAFEDGIQEIDLNLGDFASTLERISNGGELPAGGFLAMLSGLFTAPATAEQIDAARDIEGKLILRPGYDWDKPNVKDLMTSLSNRIRENFEDEFVIVTKSGLRLTRDKISLKRDCEVQGTRRILNSIQMETAMRDVLRALREARIVE